MLQQLFQNCSYCKGAIVTMKKFGIVLLIFALLLSLSACGSDAKDISKPFDTKASNASFNGSVIAENQSFRLEWEENTKGVILTDLKSNLQWGTSPTDAKEERLDEYGMVIKTHPMVNSVLSVNYLDYESNTVVNTVSYTGAVENGRVRCAKGNNSLLVEFYFDEPGFMIPVQYILQEDCLQIKVNAKDIQESENKIVSISLAPFICSAKNDRKDTYLFVPSGSGALVYPTTISQQGVYYTSQVYGYDNSIETLSKTTETESVRLPVYGTRASEDQAMLAVIDGSDGSASINVRTGASAYGYSTVYADFSIRGYTNHIADIFSEDTKVSSMVFSKNKIDSAISVKYYPLVGEKATYSGMAEIYKKYLTDRAASSEANEKSMLNLNIIGGLMLTDSFYGIPYERLYAATTLEQAANIVDDVAAQTGQSFQVVLKAFGETGIDAGKIGGGYKVGKGLGTKKQLELFHSICEKYAVDSYMDFDLVRFKKSANGFSVFSDACYNAGEQKAQQYLYNVAVHKQEENTLYYLLNPARFEDAGKKLLDAGKKLGFSGLSLETMTSMSYSNYLDKNDVAYYAKNRFPDTVSDSLKLFKNGGYRISSSAANAYAAVLADTITDVPICSDGEYIFAEDIPFYQMVFKGRASLFTPSVNLSADENRMLLKAVEGGCGLSYTLIDHWNNKMIAADYPVFYNSVYSDVRNHIFAVASKFTDYYEKISGTSIVSHEVLSHTLRRTNFSNGVSVYVNYSNQAIETSAGMVQANDYLIAEGMS